MRENQTHTLIDGWVNWVEGHYQTKCLMDKTLLLLVEKNDVISN
jgi:hypothetical protein